MLIIEIIYNAMYYCRQSRPKIPPYVRRQRAVFVGVSGTEMPRRKTALRFFHGYWVSSCCEIQPSSTTYKHDALAPGKFSSAFVRSIFTALNLLTLILIITLYSALHSSAIYLSHHTNHQNMKILTKEEEQAHYNATVKGGTIGGVIGLAVVRPITICRAQCNC